MVRLAMDIRDICYYQILVEDETRNVARYLEFPKRLTDCWHGNQKYRLHDDIMNDRYMAVQSLPEH